MKVNVNKSFISDKCDVFDFVREKKDMKEKLQSAKRSVFVLSFRFLDSIKYVYLQFVAVSRDTDLTAS